MAGTVHEPGRERPSVGRQVTRASMGTVAVLVALALGYALVVAGWPHAVSAWWRVAGDSSASLADGVALDTAAPRAVAPVRAPATLSFGRDAAALAAPLGGGRLIPVASRAQVEAVAPYGLDALGARSDSDLRGSTVVLAAGLLTFDAAFPGGEYPGAIRFSGGPHAPVATTAAQQQALVARLVAAWSSAVGSTEVTAVRARRVGDGDRPVWTADLRLRGCSACVVTGLTIASFESDGRLLYASMPTVAITGTRPIEAASAASAFDDAVHHRGDAWVAADAPVTQASLVVGDLGADQPARWEFTAADGTVSAVAMQGPMP